MKFDRAFALGAMGLAASVVALVAACSSDDATPGTAPTGTATATCAAPGSVATGAAAPACTKVQTVSAASCNVTDAGADDDPSDAGDGGAAAGDDDDEDCEYGPTQFGLSGKDDDCKYNVTYTVDSPLCEGTAGVQFTVTVTNASDNSPVTGIPNGLNIEAFIPTDPNAACDTKTTHPSPSSQDFAEVAGSPGVYRGNVVFDAPGTWTVRFHIHEECADVLEDSPHGHAAFRFTLP